MYELARNDASKKVSLIIMGTSLNMLVSFQLNQVISIMNYFYFICDNIFIPEFVYTIIRKHASIFEL